MNLNPLLPIITTNIKHSPTPSQINTNPHTKDLFTSVPITHTAYPAFSKKLQTVPKDEKKSTLKRQALIRTRLKYDTDVGIIKQGHQITMINMLKALTEKVDNRPDW